MSNAAFPPKPDNSDAVPTQPLIQTVQTQKYGVVTMRVFEPDQLMQAIHHAFTTNGVIYTRCNDGEKVYYWYDVHILHCIGYGVAENYAGDRLSAASE